jgi:predicted 3-demethylubiquinone-9 3-methyltransferase (glyoxalase superfamily)
LSLPNWQIVPDVLPQMFNDTDRDKSKRVMEAMMQMVKLDIDALQQAYNQSA